jgi:hypothetical protein
MVISGGLDGARAIKTDSSKRIACVLPYWKGKSLSEFISSKLCSLYTRNIHYLKFWQFLKRFQSLKKNIF